MNKLVATGCLVIGLVAGASGIAAENPGTSDSIGSCREEVWRVYVKPSGGNPKAAWMPRHEKRTVLVCDEKIIAQMRRRSSKAANSDEGA